MGATSDQNKTTASISPRGASGKKRPQRPRTPVGRDLETVHRFAEGLLAQHGLSGDWSVFWAESIENSDGGGVTHAHTKRIVFSAAYMAMLSPAERRDAVRHEVAHAIVGVAAGHSDVWRNKAIEIGGSGATSHTVHWSLYPWYGSCPDGHPFVSVRLSDARGFVCEEDSHEKPVPLEWWKRNAKCRAFDPGVTKMAATFPEPVSTPAFRVGDTVSVIPFGSEKYLAASSSAAFFSASSAAAFSASAFAAALAAASALASSVASTLVGAATGSASLSPPPAMAPTMPKKTNSATTAAGMMKRFFLYQARDAFPG